MNDRLHQQRGGNILYKRAHNLETFRRYIEEIPRKLRADYIYKIGVVYGNVIENEKTIKFYFEEAKS